MLDAAGGAQLLLVAHSLGAQLVGETLASDSTLRTALRASPLRTLAYFAPDVAIDRFNAYILPATNALAERIVLYASTKDRLLALSRAVNRSERSGLLRKATLPPAGLELIDVTRGASAENPIQRVFGSHHALRRASAALFDLFSIVAQGYSADCRERLGTAHANTLGIWELTAMSPPLVSVAARCTRVQ